MLKWEKWIPFLVSVVLWLLFWDVMRPLEQLGLLGNLHGLAPYLVTLALVLAMDFVPMAWWWNGLVKFSLCYGCTVYVMGAADTADALYENITAWTMGMPQAPLLEVRFWLTIFAWSIAISLLRYVLVRGSLGGWLTVVLCFYFATYQITVGLDTRMELMRSFFLGLLLTGLIRYPISSTTKEVVILQRFRSYQFGWPVALLLVSGTILLSGWLLAKDEAVQAESIHIEDWPITWSDMLPDNWNSAFEAEPVTSNLPALSGYGQDDTALGKPLNMDAALAFMAESETNAYWRGETKAVYTGRGWEDLSGSSVIEVEQSPEATEYSETIRQQVQVENPNLPPVIFHGGKLVDFKGMTVTGQTVTLEQLQYDELSGNYHAPPDVLGWQQYEVTVVMPDQLEHIETMPEQLADIYLQMPENTPDRIADLALDIVGKETSPYSQATLIQNYLRENYAYDLNDVRMPAAGADFTDDFLFELQQGYCDHFSTSMVVMLRSLDIPARWVKGFVPGPADEDGVQKVRNMHAHSWVEAYIPDQGWVLFEPTPAYAAPVQAGNAGFTEGINDRVERGEQHMEWRDWMENSVKAVIGFAEAFPFGWAGLGLAGLGFLLFGAVLIYLIPLLWQRQKWRIRNRAGEEAEPAEEQLMQLLEQGWSKLFRKFGGLKPGQTLRQYVESLPLKESEQKQKATSFLTMYETLRYSKEAVYEEQARSERIEVFRWLQKL